MAAVILVLVMGIVICAKETDSGERRSDGNTGGGGGVAIDQSKRVENHFSILEVQARAEKILTGSISGVVIFFMIMIGVFLYFVHIPKVKLGKLPCPHCLQPRVVKRMPVNMVPQFDGRQFGPGQYEMRPRVVFQQPFGQAEQQTAIMPMASMPGAGLGRGSDTANTVSAISGIQ
jgi:hypothetical protein